LFFRAADSLVVGFVNAILGPGAVQSQIQLPARPGSGGSAPGFEAILSINARYRRAGLL